MKFLTNIYDPNLPDAKSSIATRLHQTRMQAWQEQEQWLDGKVIGKPQSTSRYTVKELEEIGMVGVYNVS